MRARGSIYSETIRISRPSALFRKLEFSYASGAAANGGGASLPGIIAAGADFWEVFCSLFPVPCSLSFISSIPMAERVMKRNPQIQKPQSRHQDAYRAVSRIDSQRGKLRSEE